MTDTTAINSDTKTVTVNSATYNVVEFCETRNGRTYFKARPAWRNTRRDRYYSLETTQSGHLVLIDWGTFAKANQLVTGMRGHEMVRTLEVN